MKRMGVGGSIVVGGWESHLHGEGDQGIDVSRVDNNGHMPVNSGATRCTVARYGSGGGGREPKWDDKPRGNSRGGRSIPREPGAVKVACPVRGVGEATQVGCAPYPYPTRKLWRALPPHGRPSRRAPAFRRCRAVGSGWHIRTECWSIKALVCKPSRLALQAATPNEKVNVHVVVAKILVR